ncbi:MAG: hypothetical protein ACQEP9_05870 [Bacillota bacterium]
MKKIKMSLLLIIFILVVVSYLGASNAYSKTMILADNQQLINIFRRDNQQLVDQLVEDLSGYDQVVLHLGAKQVFRRGNAFFYKTSKTNLINFAEQLEQRDQDLYLWFLDSFGAEGFSEIYQNHQEIIDDNFAELERLDLNYKGIVIDLEWINFNDADNSEKYIEIVDYLKNKFSDKEIYAFVSLVDNQVENKKRGYYEEKLLKRVNNLIPMLYIGDGGYYLEDGELQLYLNANRVEELRNYYQKQDYEVAVAVVGRIILERNSNLYFIKSAKQFNYNQRVQLDYQREDKYVTVSGYSPKEEFAIERNDGEVEEIKEDDRLHFIQIKEDKLVQTDDYIWEYFLLQE